MDERKLHRLANWLRDGKPHKSKVAALRRSKVLAAIDPYEKLNCVDTLNTASQIAHRVGLNHRTTSLALTRLVKDRRLRRIGKKGPDARYIVTNPPTEIEPITSEGLFPVIHVPERLYRDCKHLVSKMELGKQYTSKQLAALTGFSIRQTQYRLNYLTMQHKVKRTRTGGSLYYYSLTSPKQIEVARELVRQWMEKQGRAEAQQQGRQVDND